MNNTVARIGESISLVVLTLLLVLLLNPFDFWMPSMMQKTLIGITFAVFLAVLLFIFGQEARDERDHVHRMFSDRLALLVGASILMISLIVTSLSEQGNQPWIIGALGAMALTKYLAMQYARRYK
jgi:hypothetical protein